MIDSLMHDNGKLIKLFQVRFLCDITNCTQCMAHGDMLRESAANHDETESGYKTN